MIDTHAHLNLPEYLSRIDEVIDNCRHAGLTGVVIASADLEESRIAVELAKKYPDFLYAMVGIHPHQVNSKHEIRNSKTLEMLEDLIKENKEFVVAVGETGLDDSEPPPGENARSLEEQKELFRCQLELAVKCNLPVVIHARGLVDEVIEIISEFENCKLKIENSPRLRGGIFHCYAGGKKRIPKILDLPGEWYFGIDGNVTYDQGFQNVVADIPHDRLVLETDSPWLTPEPHRGETNTPAYLPLIATQIAEIWEVGADKVSQITTTNTKKLLDLST
jgi:TatD DNase family protein